jgi:hypothetical protein
MKVWVDPNGEILTAYPLTCHEPRKVAMDMGAFEETQGHIRGLLISLYPALPAPAASQIDELVDVGELPLALQMLVRALVYRGTRISQETFDGIARLGARTGLDEGLLVGLRELVS